MERSARRRPSRDELEAARGRRVPDVLARDLDVVFVGINPGLWSAVVGHHFARPGNRFWKALHLGGLTDRLLTPAEEASLLDEGIGVTNLVDRATATADELTRDELRRAARSLPARLSAFEPRMVAMLGIGAYRTAFDRPRASVGRQPESIGRAALWVLPNPSGLNAHYQVDALAASFRELRDAMR